MRMMSGVFQRQGRPDRIGDARAKRAAIVLIGPFTAISAFPLAAQELLPEISVTAVSPIRNLTISGPLAISAETFAPVAVVTSSQLRATGATTLGDLLFTTPGVTATSQAPGAASRPVIRGLDNYRVRIQENGVGSHDVSAIGEDHGVPIDPLATEKVEVIRGPATLRWGSAAIGGVVDASNNRIPEMRMPPGLRFTTRSALSSVDNGRETAAILDASGGQFAIHADAFGRMSTDYRIPGGVQTNSAAKSHGFSIGGSAFFESGYFGLSLTQFASLYRIPGVAATAENSRIDMKQTKFAAKGEFQMGGGPIESIRYWFGATVYKHHEKGFDALGNDDILATFKNREQELRIEARQTTAQTSFGTLRGAIGAQFGNQNLGTAGGAGGLIAPAHSQSGAAYLFEELQFLPGTRLQAAGRVEQVRVRGTAVDFPVGLLPGPGAPPEFAATRHFMPKSVSLGLLHQLPWDLTASINGQYVERAPQAPELFSRGPHEATGTFEIGNPNLKVEAAKTIDLSLRRAVGDFRFEATGYYTQYTGFIYRNFTGALCDDDFSTCGTGTELSQIAYAQQNATFYGAELGAQLDIGALGRGTFGVEAQYDFVRARLSDGTNVPRMPPHRLGGGFFWRDQNWFARAFLLHAFAQNRTGTNETPTAGYNLLNAEIRYTRNLKQAAFGVSEVSFGIAGTKLLNEAMRNSVSFRKDEILLPGRNVRVFAQVKF